MKVLGQVGGVGGRMCAGVIRGRKRVCRCSTWEEEGV